MADPIFVVGYLHSGTTLLKWVAAQDPRYFTGSGETAFLDMRPTFRSLFPSLSNADVRDDYLRFACRVARHGIFPTLGADDRGQTHRRFLEDVDLGEQSWSALRAEVRELRDHDQIFIAVMDAFAKEAGAASWIEKTPTHLFYVDDILRLVPRARIIEIVRDPRAVIASKRRRRGRGRERSAYDPCWDTLAWVSAIRAGSDAARRHPDAVHRIRYEDLVERPEASVREICTFAGLHFTDEMLEIGHLNATAVDSGGGSGISGIGADRWRDELPPADRAICQFLARKEMDGLGYEAIEVPMGAKFALPVAYLRSGYEFWLRAYRRTREGGWPGLKNLAVNYQRRLQSLVSHRS